MIGRRIPHVDGKDPYHELEHPGDYVGPIPNGFGGRPAIFFIVPVDAPWMNELREHSKLKSIAICAAPPHVFRECEDGSLEIRESILVTQRWKHQEWQWHGYLDQGHSWRTV